MTSTGLPFQVEVRQLLRDRILDAAAGMVRAGGWSAVSMSRIAAEVGVSRPVLYKEFGVKQALGGALVTRETDRFITGILHGMQTHPDDPVAGLTAAVDFTLREGAENALLKAIVAGVHGPDPDLLPLLTVHNEPVLHRTTAAITAQAQHLYGLPDAGVSPPNPVVDVLVRLTLSHLLQPTEHIATAVEQIRFVLTRILHETHAPT